MKSTHMLATIISLSISGASLAGGGPYPVGDEVNAKASRAQILAELHEAQRLGVMPSTGEGEVPFISAEQLTMISDAGHRAVGLTTLASSDDASNGE